jgi:DNA polymerase/3'-5' exonuclease PolX
MTRAVPGLGPKRARILYDELGIDSIDALREAAATQSIRGVRGFGAKAEENILASLAAFDAGDVPGLRLLLPKALDAADKIVDALRAHPASERVELAGSARRLGDSVKDLDVIATAHEPVQLAQALGKLDIIESTGRATEAGTAGRTHTALPVDLKIVAPDQFGNLLQHFTGSKQHNMAMREAAVRRGLHVSEYGILDDASGETWRCPTEEEVYERLGYQWIPPELREGRGELEAAARSDLPELVTEQDLRGELHAHTTASDGTATLEEMAFAARERGFEYLAITDHSATHGFGNEVSPDQLRAQIEKVHAVNERLDGIELLAGSEVNILPDGAPDYDDELLARLDWVIGSVHTSFRMGEKAMTERMVGRHRASADRRHRPPDRAQDREPRALRRRHGAGDRRGRAHRHHDRDQRVAQPPRPRRRPRPGGGAGGRAHPRQHRRPLDRRVRRSPVGDRDGAPGVADARAGGEHAVVAGVRGAAQARAGVRPGRPRPTADVLHAPPVAQAGAEPAPHDGRRSSRSPAPRPAPGPRPRMHSPTIRAKVADPSPRHLVAPS